MQDVLKGMREKLSSDEMNDVLNELDPKKTGSFDLASKYILRQCEGDGKT